MYDIYNEPCQGEAGLVVVAQVHVTQLTILRCDNVAISLQQRSEICCGNVAGTKICRIPEKLPQRCE